MVNFTVPFLPSRKEGITFWQKAMALAEKIEHLCEKAWNPEKPERKWLSAANLWWYSGDTMGI